MDISFGRAAYRSGVSIENVLLLLNNARPHKAVLTKVKLENMNLEAFALKRYFGGVWLDNDQDVEDFVADDPPNFYVSKSKELSSFHSGGKNV